MHDLEQTIALLSRTPAVLDALLRDQPEIWTHRNEGENTMSPFEIVGHLIYADHMDWLPRANTILQHGDSKAFDAFDRRGHEREIAGKSLNELLREFATVREECIRTLRVLNLTEADLARPGRHPALGTVTLSQLVATWAAHDLTHLHQLSRVMAHQYREAVGPFREYLGVMKCNGHSS
jgi:hypothetical protein